MSVVISVDASVIVKWFKKGEKYEQEALKLRDNVLSTAVSPILSEWVYLEVVRGFVMQPILRISSSNFIFSFLT
mgnify:CR=1 FL=1